MAATALGLILVVAAVIWLYLGLLDLIRERWGLAAISLGCSVLLVVFAFRLLVLE